MVGRNWGYDVVIVGYCGREARRIGGGGGALERTVALWRGTVAHKGERRRIGGETLAHCYLRNWRRREAELGRSGWRIGGSGNGGQEWLAQAGNGGAIGKE